MKFLFYVVTKFTLSSTTVDLSYGQFNAHLIEPLEMQEAVDTCSATFNGRLPRFNNRDDFDAIGTMYEKYDFVETWGAAVDGTITGSVEHDGTAEWRDFYDNDRLVYFNWQTEPIVQPCDHSIFQKYY